MKKFTNILADTFEKFLNNPRKASRRLDMVNLIRLYAFIGFVTISNTAEKVIYLCIQFERINLKKINARVNI